MSRFITILSVSFLSCFFWSASAWAQVGGDFNGDGFDDLAIGVPMEDFDGMADAGAVHVLYGHKSGLRANKDQLWHLNVQGVNGTAQPGDQFGAAVAVGDFNGDGFDDLAVSAPFADVSGFADAGSVHVIYGSEDGLRANKDQRWHQNSEGVEDDNEFGDQFGMSLASGDFDGNGRDDLAIGVPFEDIDDIFDAGRVHILYGTSNGLKSNNAQMLEQGFFLGIEGEIEANDMFGWALVSGDFDNDNRDDLAVGVPNDRVNGDAEAGAVNVIYGTSDGLGFEDDQLWTQDSTGLDDVVEPGDEFGFALAVGDFDDNNRDDLAIGIPGEDIADIAEAGAIAILYGSNNGLRGSDSQFFTQDSTGINNFAAFNDRFGVTLAAGNFSDDDFDDLVIGIPFEDVSGVTDSGAIAVLYGKSSGLSDAGDRFFHQNSESFADEVQNNDLFGAALATGDFDGDGFDDVAVSVPLQDVDGIADAGAVHVLYGSRQKKLSGSGDQIWSQNVQGIANTAEFADSLGSALGKR